MIFLPIYVVMDSSRFAEINIPSACSYIKSNFMQYSYILSQRSRIQGTIYVYMYQSWDSTNQRNFYTINDSFLLLYRHLNQKMELNVFSFSVEQEIKHRSLEIISCKLNFVLASDCIFGPLPLSRHWKKKRRVVPTVYSSHEYGIKCILNSTKQLIFQKMSDDQGNKSNIHQRLCILKCGQ